MKILNALAVLLLPAMAHASVVAYDFAGYTNVGGATRQFTGMFEYESSAPPPPSTTTAQTGRCSRASAPHTSAPFAR